MKEPDQIANLQKRVDELEARNRRVELDKGWETSGARRLSIIIVTYCVVLIFLFIIKNSQPFINAIVPSLGFFLSTLAVGILKRHWVKTKR